MLVSSFKFQNNRSPYKFLIPSSIGKSCLNYHFGFCENNFGNFRERISSFPSIRESRLPGFTITRESWLTGLPIQGVVHLWRFEKLAGFRMTMESRLSGFSMTQESVYCYCELSSPCSLIQSRYLGSNSNFNYTNTF